MDNENNENNKNNKETEQNNKKTEDTICVLEWDADNLRPRKVRVPAVGDVPPEVWETFNEAFQKRQAKGWFESASPAEAYNFVAERLLRKAQERLDLKGASRRVYLLGVMYNSFREFGSRQIAPARQNARNLALWQRVMARRYKLEGEAVDAASLMECLPYVERPSDAYAESRRTLNELMPHLPRTVQKAFRAFLATDGDFSAMAKRLKVPVSTLYRRWKRYLATARRIAAVERLPKKR